MKVLLLTLSFCVVAPSISAQTPAASTKVSTPAPATTAPTIEPTKKTEAQLKADFARLDAARATQKTGTRERANAASNAMMAASDIAWAAFDANRRTEAGDWFARSAALRKESYENIRAYYEGELARSETDMTANVKNWRAQIEASTDAEEKIRLQTNIDTMPSMMEYNYVSMLQSLARDNNDTARALEYYTRELRIRRAELAILQARKATKLKLDIKQSEVAKALERLAYAQANMALFDVAGKSLTEALAVRRALPPDLPERQLEEALDGMAGLYGTNLGDYVKAREYYNAALIAFEEGAPLREKTIALEKTQDMKDTLIATYAWKHGTMLSNQSVIAQEMGDYKAAIEYSTRTMKVAQALPPNGTDNIFELARALLRARMLSDMADIHADSGELELALQEIEEALSIKRAISNDQSTASMLLNAARLFQQKGDLVTARRYGEQAQQIFIGSQKLRGATSAILFLAVLERDAGKTEIAARLAEEALPTARKLGAQGGIGSATRILASIRLKQNRLDDAAALLQESEGTDKRTGSKLDRIATLNLQGQLLEARGNFVGATEKYRDAISLLESTRATAASAGAFSNVKRNYQLYERMVRLLIKSKRSSEAFDYLSRAKSKHLQDSLRLSNLKTNDKELQALLDKATSLESGERTISAQIESEQAKPVAEKNVEKIETLKKLLADTQGKFLQVSRDLQKANKDRFKDVMTIQPLQLKEYQSGIPSDTIFIQYAPLGETIYVFLVTRDTLKIYELPTKREELWRLIKTVRTQIAAKQTLAPARGARFGGAAGSVNAAPLGDNLSALYDILITPITADIAPKKTVAFIPTQLLYYLPIHALAKKQDGQLRYLIEDKQVVYLTGADSIKVLLPHPDKTKGGMIAFGNPTGADLPAAEEEVKTIATVFPATRVLDGAAVTKTSVTDEKNLNTRIVHFATHGILNATVPDESYIQLAKNVKPDEAQLTVSDVLLMPLQNVDLVTLSACQTALGEGDPNGGEIISLATSFSGAGALTVVASLWSVADESTRDLMVEFYRQLAAGKPKAEALQIAQLKVMKEARYNHPYYWAPFVLMGDWR